MHAQEVILKGFCKAKAQYNARPEGDFKRILQSKSTIQITSKKKHQ
jgi:hypothetical protein